MLQPSRNMLRLTRGDTFQMPSCLVESSSLHKEYRLPCRSSAGLTVGHATHPPFLQYSPFPSRFRPLDYGDCLTQKVLCVAATICNAKTAVCNGNCPLTSEPCCKWMPSVAGPHIQCSSPRGRAWMRCYFGQVSNRNADGATSKARASWPTAT